MYNKLHASVHSALVGLSLLTPICTTATDLSFVQSDIAAGMLAPEKICYINATGAKPSIQVHDHFGGKNTCVILAPKTLSNPVVTAYTDRLITINKKSDVKLDGGHKTKTADFVSSALRGAGLVPDRPYQGTPIVDEYLAGIPMVMRLKNVEQFREVQSLITQRMIAEQVKSTTKNTNTTTRPLLVLSLENDPLLTSLNDADVAFIAQSFSLASFADANVQAMVSESWGRLKEENKALEGGKPEIINETLAETFVRLLEGQVSDFQVNKIITNTTITAAKTASTLVGLMGLLAIYKNVLEPVANKVGENLSKKIISRLPEKIVAAYFAKK